MDSTGIIKEQIKTTQIEEKKLSLDKSKIMELMGISLKDIKKDDVKCKLIVEKAHPDVSEFTLDEYCDNIQIILTYYKR